MPCAARFDLFDTCPTRIVSQLNPANHVTGVALFLGYLKLRQSR